MAESLRFGKGGLNEALEVYPDLPWQASGSVVRIYDEKKGEFVRVNEGDYIVHVGDRYEVSDKKPKEAKKATAPKEEEKPEKTATEKAVEEDRDVSVATEVVNPAEGDDKE